MAVKFPLKMSGAEVRTLEDLRKHFEINAVVEYYKNGKLLKWLEDRYYDDEVEKIEELNADDSNFKQQLCEAFGIAYDENIAIDEVRLKEKKEFLQQFTSEESIINNAAQTAIHQEDLADLLDAGTPKIYLYGGSVFNVPIRMTNKHYIGILGTPTINIRAKSQADLDAKSISFENVNLPWTTKTISTKKDKKEYQTIKQASSKPLIPKEQLQKIFEVSFNDDLERTFGFIGYDQKLAKNIWWIMKNSMFSILLNKGDKFKIDDSSKSIIFASLLQGKYKEEDLIHVRITEDFTHGWALTKDSFCAITDDGNIIVPYRKIKN